MKYNMKIIYLLTIMSITSCFKKVETQKLEYRSVEYYLKKVRELEKQRLVKEKITESYKDGNNLDKEVFKNHIEIRIKVYKTFFKDYLYQQHIEYKNDVYVLNFSLAGFDDAQWQILKWNKSKWDRSKRIDKKLISQNKENTFKKIFFNYDEGPRNIENVKMFIKNGYLVLERGNLYHSLYDLKSEKLVFNEESPWYASGKPKDKKVLNKWIKENLHDKIEKYIK